MSERAYHHGHVREASLEAALALVDAHGPDAVSLRRVAREVGLSHTAVGKEFSQLVGLLQAVATVVWTDLARHLARAAEGLDAMTGFRQMGAAYMQYGLSHPHRLYLLGHPLVAVDPSQELREAHQLSYEVLLLAVKAAMDAGEVRQADPHHLALHVWTAVHGYAQLRAWHALDWAEGDPSDELLSQLYLGLRP
ncbi:MAG: WHG domain-containing protein [Myxococcales bacterium]|nr:WHG domain-containing protein [Myxococcales bacterium]